MLFTSFVLLAYWLCAAYMVFSNVRRLREPENLLIPIENGRKILAENEHYREQTRWAHEHGFEPDCMYDYFNGGGANAKRITQSVWVNAEKRIAFSSIEVTQSGRTVIEFGSGFDNDISLATSGARDTLLFPLRPGRYVQALKKNDREALLAAHEDGMRHLQEKLNITGLQPAHSVYEEELEAFRRMGAFIESLPLWPLRAPYWFFFRRYYYFNKTIARLHPVPKTAPAQ